MKAHHAFVSGLIAGLVLDHEALVLVLVGLALGAAGGLLARELAGIVKWARRRFVRDGAPARPARATWRDATEGWAADFRRESQERARHIGVYQPRQDVRKPW